MSEHGDSPRWSSSSSLFRTGVLRAHDSNEKHVGLKRIPSEPSGYALASSYPGVPMGLVVMRGSELQQRLALVPRHRRRPLVHLFVLVSGDTVGASTGEIRALTTMRYAFDLQMGWAKHGIDVFLQTERNSTRDYELDSYLTSEDIPGLLEKVPYADYVIAVDEMSMRRRACQVLIGSGWNPVAADDVVDHIRSEWSKVFGVLPSKRMDAEFLEHARVIVGEDNPNLPSEFSLSDIADRVGVHLVALNQIGKIEKVIDVAERRILRSKEKKGDGAERIPWKKVLMEAFSNQATMCSCPPIVPTHSLEAYSSLRLRLVKAIGLLTRAFQELATLRHAIMRTIDDDLFEPHSRWLVSRKVNQWTTYVFDLGNRAIRAAEKNMSKRTRNRTFIDHTSSQWKLTVEKERDELQSREDVGRSWICVCCEYRNHQYEDACRFCQSTKHVDGVLLIDGFISPASGLVPASERSRIRSERIWRNIVIARDGMIARQNLSAMKLATCVGISLPGPIHLDTRRRSSSPVSELSPTADAPDRQESVPSSRRGYVRAHGIRTSRSEFEGLARLAPDSAHAQRSSIGSTWNKFSLSVPKNPLDLTPDAEVLSSSAPAQTFIPPRPGRTRTIPSPVGTPRMSGRASILADENFEGLRGNVQSMSLGSRPPSGPTTSRFSLTSSKSFLDMAPRYPETADVDFQEEPHIREKSDSTHGQYRMF